jgi:hypothetical protein
MAAQLVGLRKFPHPYRAALAICSDIDGTDTLEKFLAIQEFLNTERETKLGPGLGLEIGNTFFPITPDDTFSYLSSRPAERETLAAFIKAGYVDCMHSYGSGARSREDVARVLEALEEDGCKVAVWVDHSRAPTNLGSRSMGGMGAQPGSRAYHADLTLEYGIRFAWLGRSTAIVGQESRLTPSRMLRIWDASHAAGSTETLMKEFAKLALARAGSERFGVHRANGLFRTARLEDGRSVHEFVRCNSYWRSSARANNVTLAYALRREALRELVASEGVAILYTHLGYGDASGTLPAATREALHDLASEHRAGRIYVTTTSRILAYCFARRHLRWSHELSADGRASIVIHSIDDPVFGERIPTQAELQGLTFHVPRAGRASIEIEGEDVRGLVRNADARSGQESVSIPTTPLVYPA